jgi:hypothetical protein
MPATDRVASTTCFVRGTMPTIWGYLEKVEELSAPAPHIQVKTSLPGGTALRVRAKIGAQTLIARGIEPVDVSDLREGEFVEVSYRYGGEGWLDADAIYVLPERAVSG